MTKTMESVGGRSPTRDGMQTAILLLGHGSRAQEANEAMYRVRAELRQRAGYRIVEAAFMGLNPPTIEDGVAACVAQGAATVVMVPYFLHTGMHILHDIPEVTRRLQAEYPNVRLALGQPLGFHEKLVDVVQERIEECRKTVEGAGLSEAPRRSLRTGYTTGACAGAAAKAAAQALLSQAPLERVEITLPAGQRVTFAVEECTVDRTFGRCVVIKDAGDDPDATNGAEIQALVAWNDLHGITIEGGQGVGIVTKPGLELPVGEPAINPVPRRMISTAITEALGAALDSRGVRVVISVPRGEEIARRTLNWRLGIVGGISILGTTGIVVPFSHAAYTASIAQALSVAVACDCDVVVLTTGRRTERFAQALLDLPEEAFVQMGDFAGFALEECERRGLRRVTICAMIGKLAKLAAGYLQTHVSQSRLSPEFLSRVAAECGASSELVREIAEANTGRHFAEIARDNGLSVVFSHLCQSAANECAAHVDGRLSVTCILTDFEGAVIARATSGG